MIHHFEKEEEEVALFLELLRQKRAKGYKPAAVRLTQRTCR